MGNKKNSGHEEIATHCEKKSPSNVFSELSSRISRQIDINNSQIEQNKRILTDRENDLEQDGEMQ